MLSLSVKKSMFFGSNGGCNSSNASIPQSIDLNTKKSKELLNIIEENPICDESKSIYSIEKLFKLIQPIHWIISAKNSVVLFKEILKKEHLAEWVNQFPAKDHSGLLMIATFTKDHLKVAYELGQNIFSNEDMTKIQNAMIIEGSHNMSTGFSS